MFKILLIIGSFDTILCRILTKTSYTENNLENQKTYPVIVRNAREVPYCENFGICKTIDTIKGLSRGIFPLSLQRTSEYDQGPSSAQERSYYSGYGAPTTPAYYPAFDPLSVLASLAFLAFLLQSFASLFDRSRSILSTTVSARESAELETLGLTRRILRALDKYENRNRNLIANVKKNVKENVA